ncbi:hypothetical protein LX97_02625 [Nonlabens dokdonensis]|jgi:hypothetical protein|uniref:Uncharacterized protein n=2 Tax=Nonlabens dokdonensis TaxID=328515 RepID=L7WF85_NONDD|nr:hypothetical protein [Nonlabens dokdonensis]AGC78611.1 hypothetical protein DDD_3484 [Nonlabens dokdonensis DSW-6]PZX39259.1 hypothetical protein LX97_02625 [Nonlabens dokdonensis]
MNDTQLIFITIGLISLFLIYQALRIFIKAYRCKTITEFPLENGEQNITFQKSGLYTISFIGARHVNFQRGFQLKMTSKSGAPIHLNQSIPQFTFRSKGIYGVTCWSFSIDSPRECDIVLSNIENLAFSQSQLSLKRIFTKEEPPKFVKVLIKEGITTFERLVSIIGLVLGVNGLGWGIMIGVFNMFDNI